MTLFAYPLFQVRFFDVFSIGQNDRNSSAVSFLNLTFQNCCPETVDFQPVRFLYPCSKPAFQPVPAKGRSARLRAETI